MGYIIEYAYYFIERRMKRKQKTYMFDLVVERK